MFAPMETSKTISDKMAFPLKPQDLRRVRRQQVKEAKEGYTLVKLPIGFHNGAMIEAVPDAWYDRNGRAPDRHPT